MADPALTTIDLSIGYGTAAAPLAAGLELGLPRGQLVCLLGPNGTGKSTLLRTLCGLQPPLAGRVLLEGQDLRALSPVARGQRLAVVLTDRITAGMMTGHDVVALGRHPHTDWTGSLTPRDHEAIARALESTDATTLAARQMAELSDGERQRVMVARAVAQEPAVMLLDEITAFLDLPRRIEIMDLLAALAHDHGLAIVVSTHDLELALRTADRLWLFHGGRLDVGAPEDLVLSGAFDEAFAAHGLSFDRETGRFRSDRIGTGAASVIGAGPAAVWTARAVERAGYTLTCGPDTASIRVEVRHTPAGIEWLLEHDHRVEVIGTLEMLVARLRARDASAARPG
jgi:iron complex transport system ATP-binding protein